MENIKRIPFTDARYEYYASDKGRIFKKLEKELKPIEIYKSNKQFGKTGCMIANKKGGHIFFYVDKLVWWAFKGRLDLKYVIFHKDGNLANNELDNLERRKQNKRGNGDSLFSKLKDNEFKLYNDALDKIPKWNYEKFNTEAYEKYVYKVKNIKDAKIRELKLTKIFAKLVSKLKGEENLEYETTEN